MHGTVLMIVTMVGAENCARVVAEELGSVVEVANGRRAGLQALRRGAFDVVVVEEYLVESDSLWADALWSSAGLAMVVQVNFGIAGVARLTREVKAALQRLDGERVAARRVAARVLEDELKSSVTGLLLESELLLREPSISPALEPKLRHMVELASGLRERLRGPVTVLK